VPEAGDSSQVAKEDQQKRAGKIGKTGGRAVSSKEHLIFHMIATVS
jgi:hypothetical protein